MNKVNLDTWIQLLGLAGVTASLIFVGIELRQSQQIAVAGQIQGRNQMQSNYLLAPLEGALQSIGLGAEQDYDSLTPEQLHIREQLIRHRALTITNAWQQYTLGLLTEDAWQVPARRAQTMYNNCRERFLLLSTFTPSLAAHAETNWKKVDC